MKSVLLVLLSAAVAVAFVPGTSPARLTRTAPLQMTPEVLDLVSAHDVTAVKDVFTASSLQMADTFEQLGVLGKGKISGVQVGFCLFAVPYCIVYQIARTTGAADDKERAPTGVSATRAKR